MQDVVIRDATSADVPLIARCVMAAIDMFDWNGADREQLRRMATLEHVCALDDTLYSYRNTRIADVDGRASGCLISYRGEDYIRMRERTFGMISDIEGIEISDPGIETGPGEFYLDSMAIVPSERGHRIGERLLLDGIRRGTGAGYSRISLIAAEEHPKLVSYYRSIGFSGEERLLYFGEMYIKMYYTKAVPRACRSIACSQEAA